MKKLILLMLGLMLFAIKVQAVPSIINVSILPQSPNAGQDLFCNYNYTNTENYTEQNSSINWYKNGVKQGIDSEILNKNNLSINDKWLCEVTGYDGQNFSSPVMGSNVTILNTVQNVVFYINDSNISKESNYFGIEKQLIGFDNEINEALQNCTEDEEGYCNVTLTFTSDSQGLLNLSDLAVYYTEDAVSLDIPNLTEHYTNYTLKIFEFTILNNGERPVTNVQW